MHQRADRSTRHRRGDQGFGLIEVVVALAVLMIAIVPLEFLIANITSQAAQVREKVAATGVAEKWLEYYNNLPLSSFPHNLPTTIAEPATVIGGITYNANVQLQWGDAGLTGNLCTTGSTPQIVSAIANVTWGSSAGIQAGGNQVQEQTVINPPYGLLQPNQGFLALQVDGATGPLTTPDGESVIATISPSPYAAGVASAAVTVPAGGCIFTAANNGTYTIALSTTGTASPYLYVDNTESLSPSSVPLTVASGSTRSYVMTYDEGGAIGLTYAATAGLAGGGSCPTASTCFEWGWGPGGVEDLLQGSPSGGYSLVPLPTGVTAITDVSCLSATVCYFTGVGPSNTGLLIDDNGGTLSTISIPVPSTVLSSVACLNASTCYAVGTNNSSTAVLLAVNGTSATSAMPTVSGITIATLNSVECSNSNNCLAVGSGTTVPTTGTPSPTAVVLATTGSNWSSSTVPGGVTRALSVACDPYSGANTPICVTAVQTTQPTVMTSPDDGVTWTVATAFPAGVTSVGPLACTGPSNCVATVQTIAASGTTAATASTTDGTHWALDTGWPNDLESITALVCPSASSCLASGVDSTSGIVASNTAISATSAGTWRTQSLAPSQFLSNVGCMSTSACVATGGSATGPVAFVTSDSGTTWTAPTLASHFSTLTWSPSPVTALPITVSNGLLPGTQTKQMVTAGGSTNPTLIPNLFPFSSTATQPDYGVWAGDNGCLNEVPNPSDLDPIPVTGGQTSPASIPLSLLAIAVNRPNGTPVSGASAALTVSTAGCPADTFGVPVTSSAGLIEVGIPTGVTVGSTAMTYSITVSASGQTSGPTSLAIGPTGVTNVTTGLSYPYPTPVPFTLNVP
jgi:Tfp pilus assembly protein PilV